MAAKPLVTTANVSAANAIRTRSFWLLWMVLFCNVTAGIGILEQASPMIQDFFRDNGTSAVTVAAAGGFVGCCRCSTWPAGSCGRPPRTSSAASRSTWCTWASAWCCTRCWRWSGTTSTALFVLLAGVILSFYGGGFATVPAYLRDLFGTFQVGAIHGRLLTAWSAAGVAGPLIINGFLDAQGKPGTLTAAAYRPALFTMVGVLAVGFVANLLVRPVPQRYHEPSAEQNIGTGRGWERGSGRGRGHDGAEEWYAMSEDSRPGQQARLWISWLVVAALLGYGVAQTVVTAAKLFTH